jgi:hypothetical protein
VSTNEIMHRISQGGEKGVRKTELKKEFQNTSIDDGIGSLIKNGDIVMDKKGTAYYLWRADDYTKYLLTTDTKFKLLYSRIEEMKTHLEAEIRNGGSSRDTSGTKNSSNDELGSFEGRNNSLDYSFGTDQISNLDKDKFRKEFDLVLRKCSGPSGWVLLATIREEMERKYDLRREDFYAQVKEMTNREYNTYELSSGGIEGITVRGLLHGFVRCI